MSGWDGKNFGNTSVNLRVLNLSFSVFYRMQTLLTSQSQKSPEGLWWQSEALCLDLMSHLLKYLIPNCINLVQMTQKHSKSTFGSVHSIIAIQCVYTLTK